MKKVESFDLDHTLVKAPYIRLADQLTSEHGDVVYKYDLRFCQPNKTYMEMKGLHSLEHLMAQYIRDHIEGVIDIGPMGCQTGFYLSVFKEGKLDNIAKVLEKTLNDVLNASAVPGCNEKQCGFAANHSLSGAKEIARQMLKDKEYWLEVF